MSVRWFFFSVRSPHQVMLFGDSYPRTPRTGRMRITSRVRDPWKPLFLGRSAGWLVKKPVEVPIHWTVDLRVHFPPVRGSWKHKAPHWWILHPSPPTHLPGNGETQARREPDPFKSLSRIELFQFFRNEDTFRFYFKLFQSNILLFIILFLYWFF